MYIITTQTISLNLLNFMLNS